MAHAAVEPREISPRDSQPDRPGLGPPDAGKYPREDRGRSVRVSVHQALNGKSPREDHGRRVRGPVHRRLEVKYPPNLSRKTVRCARPNPLLACGDIPHHLGNRALNASTASLAGIFPLGSAAACVVQDLASGTAFRFSAGPGVAAGRFHFGRTGPTGPGAAANLEGIFPLAWQAEPRVVRVRVLRGYFTSSIWLALGVPVRAPVGLISRVVRGEILHQASRRTRTYLINDRCPGRVPTSDT
jgi:hypothetical protein